MKVVFAYMGWENLGIEYLSSYLEKNGHNTSLVFDPSLFNDQIMFDIPFLAKIFDQKKAIIRQILEEKPDLLCFSVITNNYKWALEIAKKIRQKSKVPIVFGGHHATAVPKLVLDNNFVDYVIVGEAEEALLELVAKLEKKQSVYKIKNLAFVRDGKKIVNPLRPLIQNISELPFPNKKLFAKYIPLNREYMILTSRGCPFGCTYCCNNFYRKIYSGKGKYVRRNTVDYVINELKTMKKLFGFRRILAGDDVFTMDLDWLKEFRDKYRKEINLPIFVVSHPKFITEEVLKILKECRCYYIEMGVQTTNMRIKKNIIKRTESNDDIARVLNLCKKYRIKSNVDHIYGFPTQNEKDMKYAAEFYSTHKPSRITFYQLSYFPATEIIDICKKFGKIKSEDIDNMNEGNDKMYFSGGSLKRKKDIRIAKNYEVFFKLISLLPKPILYWMLTRDIQDKLHNLPSVFITLLNFMILIKNWEYRGFDYIYYYLKNIPRVTANKVKYD
jgi:radical SAM superfamily enzyme YgiQ (UPF0313 family)